MENRHAIADHTNLRFRIFGADHLFVFLVGIFGKNADVDGIGLIDGVGERAVGGEISHR